MPKKTALAILLFAAIVFGLEYAPPKSRFKLDHFDIARIVELKPHATTVASVTPPPEIREHVRKASVRPDEFPGRGGLIDPRGNLNSFYQALWRTEAKIPGAVTRVLHYGDSPVTADSITADARALLQQRFGDAGHGFVLIAKPWAWYGHRGIKLSARGWHMEPASQSRARDGIHGLGGVSFTGGVSASSTIELPDDQHTHMQVFYEQQPNGGSFQIVAAGAILGNTNTASDAKIPGFAGFDLPPHTRLVTLSVTSGTVRLFGWSFEKPGPGIIYNSLGLNGAQVQMALRYFEPAQWAEEMQHEHPDLVVINYGTNESVFPEYIERYYEKELRALIERVRGALPRTSLLIMSPMDRGVRDSDGEIVTPEVLPRIVEIQEKVALETGCAFFNTYEAMGGAGTMAKWYASQPRLVSADFMHPLPGGAAVVGRLLDKAILDGFDRYKTTHLDASTTRPTL